NSVTKSVDSSSVIAGDTVIFKLEVEITGTADATKVGLSDTMALEFEFVSSTPVPTTNTVTALGTELTFDIGTVAVGDTATITIEVKTDSSVTPATLIENKAQADGDNFGVSDSNTVEVTINPTSGGGGGPTDPTITKDTSDINPTAGQVITYTIEVENSSSSTIVDVIITDVLDENLEFVSADTAPTTNTTVLDITTLTWEIGDLLVGETFLIELRVEVKNATNPGTVIKNDAELSALGFGPVIASAPDVEVISTGGGGGSSGGGGGGAVPVPTPNYQADLDFQFADPKTKGEDYGESVTIINTGSIALSPGDLVLTFPASLDVVTANPSANSIVGNVFTWSIPVIPVAGTYRVEFTVKPNTPGPSIITVANFYIGNQQIAVSSVSESVGDVKGAKTPEDLPRTGAGVAYLLLFNLPLLLLRRLKRASAAVLLLIAGFFVLNFNYFKEVIGFSLNEKSGQQEQLLSEEILAPNTLTVPSLGIVVPIIIDSGKSEEEFQAALRNGVVHYPGTSQVGRFGNSYIFGHSSDYLWSEGNYKTVFAVLPKINIGAEIVATDTEGQEYAYYVKETKVVGPSDLSVLEQDYSKKVLTLQTSYPIGTALRRFIVISELKEE
ncbi:MAG: sortase, partial [bacterium]|nr:sortase [bacterium]